MIQTRLINLSLIDPPDIAMRSQMDDDKLQDLARSITATGLINPIAVMQNNGRYRIVAGHRRFCACQMNGRAEIEAKDYTGSGMSEQAVKFAENKHREDVNPADEALWLAEIQEAQHLTLEQLQGITGESEDWISRRLSLMRGDEHVYLALKASHINFGHALVLNRFPDQFREQYLHQVIQSTPPVRVVEDWLRQLKLMGLENQKPAQSEETTTDAAPLPGAVMDTCGLCQSNHAPWDMEFVKIHKMCLASIIKAIKEQGT